MTRRLFLVAFFVSLAITTSGCFAVTQKSDQASASNAELAIVPRAVWGSVDSHDTLFEHRIDKITIHHGGTAFSNDRDPKEYLRGLQAWSRADKGWIDIPYHFVIDLEGIVYEARPLRYPGDTNTSYDPTGHVLVQVVGNYEERELSSAQLRALIDLSAMLVQRYDVGIADIRGHLDYAPGETVCPGEGIYRFLRTGAISDGVTELLSTQSVRP